MTNWCIVYLASPKSHRVLLGGVEHMYRIELLKSSLTIAKRIFPNIDIVLFHEDYTEHEIAQLPELKEIIQVDFETGSEEFVRHRRPKGYMMMCRFFSGIMQKHEQLQKYTHYMRLDDDSYFLEPYPQNIEITQFLENDYVYRTVFRDKDVHQELLEYTISFLMRNGIPMYKIYQKMNDISGFLDDQGKYSGLAPYNNFHTTSLNFWRHPLISSFLDSLEKDKCIMKKGWMDANIHAMLIYVIAPFTELKIKECTSFGYRHNQHVSVQNSTGLYYDINLSFIENP